MCMVTSCSPTAGEFRGILKASEAVNILFLLATSYKAEQGPINVLPLWKMSWFTLNFQVTYMIQTAIHPSSTFTTGGDKLDCSQSCPEADW